MTLTEVIRYAMFKYSDKEIWLHSEEMKPEHELNMDCWCGPVLIYEPDYFNLDSSLPPESS